MQEYCRLCAELKDPDEIVSSIDDIGQFVDQKLRACCQWTTENIEHQLPHSVCSICLDKLENCWLFSQSVQSAQQRLLEIFEDEMEVDAKSFGTENVQNDWDSAETLNNFPCTSTAQNPNVVHRCEICAHEFRSSTELNVHRQQGCIRSIEIAPIAVDFAIGSDEIQAVDEEDSRYIVQPSTEAKRVANNQHKQKRSGNGNGDSQNEEKSKKRQQLNQGVSKEHLHQEHAVERILQCQLCANEFKGEALFSVHLVKHVRSSRELKIEEINNKLHIIRTNGGDPIEIPSDITIFKCDVCDEVYTKRNSLEVHRTLHSSERLFECWMCHKTYKTLQYIKEHIKLHVLRTPQRQVKLNSICEICGKAFKSTSDLSLHSKMKHSDERPFRCETCGFRFKIERLLKIHLLTHSGAPQFKCNQCNRAFKSNYSLRKHMETHSGVISKPHVCDFCGKEFRKRSVLKDHRSMHTGEIRFKCKHCSSGFGASSCFYTHMRKVHGISLLAQKKEKLKE